MKALSIMQPWLWAILHGGEKAKRCENRDWEDAPGLISQALALVGTTILLHAGKGVGTQQDFAAAVDSIGAIFGCEHPPEDLARVHYRRGRGRPGGVWVFADDLFRGAIVGRARLDAVVLTDDFDHRLPHKRTERGAMGGEVWDRLCSLCGAEAALVGNCPNADPWAIPGQIGLLLADVEELEGPVLRKGFLGFFEVPDEVLAGAMWKAAGGTAR